MADDNDNSKAMDLNRIPFEEALNKAGFGLYSFILTALAGLSILSSACVIYGSSIIVPTSACELQTTLAQQGMIVASPLLGTIVGAVLWGYLADTRGRRNMLLVSFLSGAIFNALASISVNWGMLMALQFVASLLASGQYSLAMTLLSECVPLARRNLVVLIVASIFLLSQGIMALLAIPIIPLEFSYHLPALDIYWNPWRTVLLVYSLPSLICLVWLYFMEESPKFVFAKGDEERALRILTVIHRMNHRKSKEGLQVKGLLSETSQASGEDQKRQGSLIGQLFKPPLAKYLAIMTTLSVFLKVSAFMVWLPTIANQFVEIVRTGEGYDRTLCDILLAGQEAPPNPDLPPCALNETALLIVFTVGCLQSVFNICVSLVIDKIGRRNTVIAISATCGVSGIVINFVPNAIGGGVFFLIFLLGMVLLGLQTAMSVALFPTHLRAMAMSLAMTGGRLTLIAVVQILNFLLDNNCNMAFYIFASLLIASAMIAGFLPDDRKLRNVQPQVESREAIEDDADEHLKTAM